MHLLQDTRFRDALCDRLAALRADISASKTNLWIHTIPGMRVLATWDKACAIHKDYLRQGAADAHCVSDGLYALGGVVGDSASIVEAVALSAQDVAA